MGRARTALDRAIVHLQTHHYGKAINSFRIVRLQLTRAHAAGRAQIGAPPTDPESDDPPGPPSVLAVLNLDHRVATKVVPIFNGMRRPGIVWALRRTMWRMHYERIVMLNAVIRLPDEGAGADYVDGMADTVGIYTQEVRRLQSALATYRLSSTGRTALRRALVRSQATKTKFDRAFGGPE